MLATYLQLIMRDIVKVSQCRSFYKI